MTAAQVHAFFKDYADAFSKQQVDRIQSMWSFPAFMSLEGQQFVFHEDDFRSNTQKICAFYARQGLCRAEKEVLDLNRLTLTTATVRTLDKLFNVEEQMITSWEHVYLLSETPEGLRVAAALPDNEVAAWRSRGTPLGGN